MRATNGEPSYEIALRRFVDAVQNRKDGERKPVKLPDLNDGFRSLAVVAAAEESTRSGHAQIPEMKRRTS